MSTFALTDAKILMGGYDLSGFHNSLNVVHGAEPKDDTVFGTSGTRSFKAGLKTLEADAGGFWDTLQDEVIFDRIQAAREVFTFAAVGETIGDIVYSSRMVNGQYNPGESVGELLKYTFTGRSANTPLVRGHLLAIGEKSADANGTGVQAGAVLSTQRVYGVIHAFAVDTDVTVTIESAPDNTFAGATTRLTFTTLTDIGADWQEAAGPITDTWWRAVWDVTGPAEIYVMVGIL